MDTDLIKLAEFFADEGKAIEFIEALRWPDGPVCPHCKSTKAYALKVKSVKRKVWKCASCRKQFSVMIGTIFESSHIPLNKWLAAIYLMCSSKKSMSAHQIHRSLSLTYKSAWFMCHRIRFAMDRSPSAQKLQGVVEVDETYVGGKVRNRFGQDKGTGTRGRGADNKTPVVALIERNGEARAFKVANVGKRTLQNVIKQHVETTSDLMTDSLRSYRGLDKDFKSHQTVDHGKEYVRGIVHTNFAESYFSLFKRGIMGAFHHISEKHMNAYLAEFNFRWNGRELSDGERTARESPSRPESRAKRL